MTPSGVIMVGSGALLGWLGTLCVLLLAPVPQLNVCKDTSAPPIAVHERDPCPGPPNSTLDWSPVLSGRWKQRGCIQGCSGWVTLWGLWPGKKNAF